MRLLFFWMSIVILALCSCSSKPRSVDGEPEPAWVHQTTRTIDSGYIVYVGMGEDRTLEGARFKAEGMAIQDLANECSFAPKGARVEDRFDEETDGIHRSYAKIGIEFDECEAAKKEVDPTAIRTAANIEMTEELKRYQDTVAQAETNPPPPAVAANGSIPTASPGMAPVYAGPPVIVAASDYYVVRQQIVYSKQIVILSPPGAYPPGAPQTTQFVTSMHAPVQQVIRYEAANPQIRNSPATWSSTMRTMPRAMQQNRPMVGARPAGNGAFRPPPRVRPAHPWRRRRRW